ncbi:F-box/kelch-repeat protein At1g57790 isoform X2 [Spinacia oleracea]|nr:F-box/kelch-repeat protein At1g57790-like isoform X2 [Spinacia oleracea]
MEVADDYSHSLTVKSLQMKWPGSGIGCFQSVEYWVESCDQIYYVCVYIRHTEDHRISVVKVLELDLFGRNWVEVKSLDGRAFFLGKDCSTWCWGSNTTTSDNVKSSSTRGGGSGCIRGDCVYFLFPERDCVYYCYSLDDCTLSVFESCPNMQTPYSSPIWLNMMQQHHRSLGVLDVKGKEWSQIKENVDDEGVDNVKINWSKEIQGESPRFVELPHHLIDLISKYMHLFDFWNFRASCKTFQSAVVPLTPLCRNNNMLPLFVFLKNDGRFCEILDPSRDDSCTRIFQLSSEPFAIDFFKDGWLVISVGSSRSLKYFNPFTKVRGDFPTDGCLSCFSSIGFSTYPTSPDCMTVAIVEKYIAVEINYVKYGDESWDSFELRYEDIDLDFHPGTSSPIDFEGTLYILDRVGYLGAFVLVKGEESWRVYDRPQTQLFDDLDSAHLVMSGGQLHAVFIGYMGKWIEVFKFNLLTENWCKVRSLGNHSFFISHTSSFSVETTEAWMRNRIYLSRVKGNGIVFYSLDTGKYHVFGSEESMENLYGTKEPTQCCWL